MTTALAPPNLDLDALSAAIDAQLSKPVTAPPPDEPRPKFAMPRVEAHPTLMEAITTAVEAVLTGNHKATVEKRKKLLEKIAEEVGDVPIYGIELDGARLPIGEGVDFDNAVVETDGYGRAVTITVDAGTPIWEPQ